MTELDDLKMRLARDWAPAVYASLTMPTDEELEDSDGLTVRQNQQRLDLLRLVEEHGPFDQTIGSDGAHYAPAAANPFKDDGITCANCVFWEDDEKRCEIIDGTLEPDAVCKLWIIPQSKLSSAKIRDGQEKAEEVTKYTHAGLMVHAADTGRVLLIQRANDPEDEAAGMFEPPGGSIDEGETALEGAMREFSEETGMAVPDGEVVATWESGSYIGHVLRTPSEDALPIQEHYRDRARMKNPDDPEMKVVEQLVWWDPELMVDNPAIRREMRASMPTIISLLQLNPEEAAKKKQKCEVTDRKYDEKDEEKKPWERALVTTVNGRTFITARAAIQKDLALFDRVPSNHPMMTWVQGRYVGGDEPNRNGAMWSAGDLQMALPTVNHGPLNWLHESRHIVGSIVDAKFVAGDPHSADIGEYRPFIASLAGIWNWEWPDEAEVVKMASETGKLYQSMECIAEQIACIGPNGCGQTYDYAAYSHGESCEHLQQRVSDRQLIKPTFLGAGVIVPPARPGWAFADMQVMRQAAKYAETASEQVGGTWGMTDEDWEAAMAQILIYAGVK